MHLQRRMRWRHLKENRLTRPAPEFSVVIVNYNGGAFIQQALDSLAAQTRRNFEVILVDNASKDGSIDELDTSGLPAFKLMAEPINHGFAAANNSKGPVARLLEP